MITDRPQFWRLSRFTELEDTPSTFLGQGLKLLQINALETKLAPVVQVRNFLQLDDTPASFIGHANRLVRVNPLANALDFTDPVAPGITAGWELIRTGTFTTSFNITGLLGNTDKLWMLIMRSNHTANHTTSIRFNGDATVGNYRRAIHRAALAGGIEAHSVNLASADKIGLAFWDRFNYFSKSLIRAESGFSRLVLSEFAADTDASNYEAVNLMGTWVNTTAEITTINVILSTTISAGEFWLFRRRV